ncbi:LON peptidase N-terminal domain and RING finger protein 1-like [Portunus trituberculatus]|uniref:LON peptidase N-terminal domain and RING finger protein 1-like n=1 Tax=Portunus trituberculatus TaxID=210409 RepID=UPI001E1CBFB9|nr:LON peptidase N-terminal domain and RING finger protein 1-like [Portunus trituberculatus]
MSAVNGGSEKSAIGGILSSEMFDKILKEKGPKQEIYVSYATLFAEKGQIVESLELLFHTYKLYNMNSDKLYQVISKIVDYLRLNWKENGPPPTRNVFSCPVCWGVLHEPLTLVCGHTYCRKCLLKEQLRMCRVCQYKFKDKGISNVKPNVLVATLVSRWWQQEVDGVKLRTEGNKYFQNQQLEKALEAYIKAFKSGKCTSLICHNHSMVSYGMTASLNALFECRVLLELSNFVCVCVCVCVLLCNIFRIILLLQAFHRLLIRLTSNRRYSMEGRNNCHHHSYSCLSPAHSDPSIIPESDSGEDSEDSEDGHQQSHCGPSAPPVEEVSHLRKIMDKFNLEMERNKKSSCGYVRMVEVQNYDKNDFECTLCYRYLYQPVTTPCGHSFCRTCLDRCLDHSTSCPLCKTSIKMFLAERRTAVTEFVEVAMQTVMASECRERKQQHDEEMDELAAAGKDSQHGIPIFIATLAIPTISCPLHVFEPRYRLMIRRCMESGTREFGMCMPMENAENGYADSGTMLEIRDIEYTPDGRSIVNTVGSRRFRIVSKSVKDGYNTAAVEFLQDAVPTSNLLELHKLHDCVHKLASKWYESIEHLTKRRILVHYGPMPPVEGEYWTIPNGPAWMWWVIAILPLDHRIQLSILNETSLKRRLEILHKIVRCVLVQQHPQQTPAEGSQ